MQTLIAFPSVWRDPGIHLCSPLPFVVLQLGALLGIPDRFRGISSPTTTNPLGDGKGICSLGPVQYPTNIIPAPSICL